MSARGDCPDCLAPGMVVREPQVDDLTGETITLFICLACWRKTGVPHDAWKEPSLPGPTRRYLVSGMITYTETFSYSATVEAHSQAEAKSKALSEAADDRYTDADWERLDAVEVVNLRDEPRWKSLLRQGVPPLPGTEALLKGALT